MDPISSTDTAAEVSSVGSPNPMDALSVRCPICGALPGFECVEYTTGAWGSGLLPRSPHLHRIDDAWTLKRAGESTAAYFDRMVQE